MIPIPSLITDLIFLEKEVSHSIREEMYKFKNQEKILLRSAFIGLTVN